MTKETKKWWEKTSAHYQKQCDIPIDVHYGPGSPNEKKLKLLGDVRGKKILEIGCGGAQCGIALAKQGAHVIGIDISGEQLKFAWALAKKNQVKIRLLQGDIKKLPQIKPNSQDIVFSAFALLYVDDLKSCFEEVHRVLKKKGVFVFSIDHPFSLTVSSSLRIKRSYFETGKVIEKYGDNTFVSYTHTISEWHNLLVENGFVVEKMLEPDSRKRYPYDHWYGLWHYTPKFLKLYPQTIIFKCRKGQ
ncbi:MAG TPA: methyltransferase domain-containing protein [Candidatus Nanoarchaeia archaeon]|nr:methyltransferase domain-containing protein [Candidatus Nanoarchaeia archaeon]